MKLVWKTGLILTLIPLIALVAEARVDISQTRPVVLPQENLQTTVTSKDVAEIIPLDMAASQNAGFVATRIGDHALQSWLKSPAVQGSNIGRTASTVENSMRTEVSVKSADPEGVSHKFSFQYMALQSVTRLQYSGWLNAMMNYDARAGETFVEFTDRVWKNKDLFVNHTVKPVEGVSALGVRWSW